MVVELDRKDLRNLPNHSKIAWPKLKLFRCTTKYDLYKNEHLKADQLNLAVCTSSTLNLLD
jgi:hypothetical protein